MTQPDVGELGKWAKYRDAVRAGLYHEGWGSAGPDQPLQLRVMFAHPLPAERVEAWRERLVAQSAHMDGRLRKLGVVRLRVYLQDTPAGRLPLVACELVAYGSALGCTINADLLRLLDLHPGVPGPAGSAALAYEWASDQAAWALGGASRNWRWYSSA